MKRAASIAAALLGLAHAPLARGAPDPIFVGQNPACGNLVLLSASGYPGPDRQYTIRGYCRFTNSFQVVLFEFEATAVCQYHLKTGMTSEDSSIDGKQLHFRTKCTSDPFLSPTHCDPPLIDGGGVDPRLVTALKNRRTPIFRGAVNPAEAEKYSTMGSSKPPPPPPTPLGPSPAPTKPPLRLPKAPEPAVGGQPVVPAAPAQAGQQPAGGTKASGKAVSNPAVPTPKPTPARGGLGAARSRPSPTPTKLGEANESNNRVVQKISFGGPRIKGSLLIRPSAPARPGAAPASIPAPPLSAGAFLQVEMTEEVLLHSGGTVTADALGQIDEGNEKNNDDHWAATRR
jgi:hypothetical protein